MCPCFLALRTPPPLRLRCVSPFLKCSHLGVFGERVELGFIREPERAHLLVLSPKRLKRKNTSTRAETNVGDPVGVGTSAARSTQQNETLCVFLVASPCSLSNHGQRVVHSRSTKIPSMILPFGKTLINTFVRVAGLHLNNAIFFKYVPERRQQ